MFQNLTTGLDRTITRLEFWRDNPGVIAGTPTGFNALDDATGGFEDSDLWVLGGRPGMGKTALALNMAARVARQSTETSPVLFVSTEMPRDLLLRRLASMASSNMQHAGKGKSISEYRLRTGKGDREEYDRFAELLRRVSTLPLLVSDRPGVWSETKDPLDAESICGSVRRLALEGVKPRLLVVDHIGRIGDNPTDSPNYRVGRITRNLKNLAMEVGCPVLALSQLNRSVEQREDKRPGLSDLRDSGEVEQEADVVALMYRQDYYLQQGTQGYDNRLKGKCLIEIAKARSGPTGELALDFDATTTSFHG